MVTSRSVRSIVQKPSTAHRRPRRAAPAPLSSVDGLYACSEYSRAIDSITRRGRRASLSVELAGAVSGDASSVLPRAVILEVSGIVFTGYSPGTGLLVVSSTLREPRLAAGGYPRQGADAANAANAAEDRYVGQGRIMARTRNRTRNAQLAAVIVETSLSQEQVAARMVRVAAEVGATELLGITRSHVSQWILGSQPKGRAALILCETLSRHLRRRVTPAEVGLQTPLPDAAGAPEWSVDTLT